jgi:hypothetical protein
MSYHLAYGVRGPVWHGHSVQLAVLAPQHSLFADAVLMPEHGACDTQRVKRACGFGLSAS